VLFFAASAAVPAVVAAQVEKQRPELATLIVAAMTLLLRTNTAPTGRRLSSGPG